MGGRTQGEGLGVHAGTTNQTITVTAAMKSTFQVVVIDGGNGNAYDRADWADGKFVCS